MMDFSKMAQAALAEQAQADADKKAERKREQEAETARFEHQVVLLQSRARPQLADALAQFAAIGIPTEIRDNWTGAIGRPMRPQLEFQGVGQPIANRAGGSSTPKSITAFFEIAPDETLTVRLSDDSYGKFPKTTLAGASDDERLAAGVEAVLKSFIASRSACGSH